MLYSVWKPGPNVYEYYETSEQPTAPPAPKLRPTGLGLTPDEAAWRLPSDAKPVGQGPFPKGMVASRASQGLGALDMSSNFLGMVGFGLAAIGLYMAFKEGQ